MQARCPPTGTTDISPCRRSLRAPSSPPRTLRTALLPPLIDLPLVLVSLLYPLLVCRPVYIPIYGNTINNDKRNEADIGEPGGTIDTNTNATAADTNNKNTWPANCLLSTVLQPQRNTFASILRRLRGSGPVSERGWGRDNFSSMSGHSFVRSRSA